jgi:CubicO group peptidase (beta-lactamase class C family)
MAAIPSVQHMFKNFFTGPEENSSPSSGRLLMRHIKRIRNTLLAATMAVMIAQPCNAALPITGVNVPELSGLDAVVTSWAQQYGVNAATLAVSRNGRLVYEKGYGYQDQNLTSPILPNARMRLASNSITLTRRALRQLIADGKLNANDLVYQVVGLQPWWGFYADSRMKKITIQHIIDNQSGLTDFSPSVKQIGQYMRLGRNATPAEIIRYMWSQRSTMVATPGTNSGSHYAYGIGCYIIAKTTNPSLDITDYESVGKTYGQYVNQFVGSPIGAVYLQAENMASQAHENEIWYESDYDCDPEWDRLWAGYEPLSCAYAIDFYAEPGAGTLVSSARDFALFFEHYWPDGSPRPTSMEGYNHLSVGYGSLPGSTTVSSFKVEPSGDVTSFVFLANRRHEVEDSPAQDEITENIQKYLAEVPAWPMINLWDTGGNTDTTPPQIILSGANPLTLTVGAQYRDPGYTAYDNVDGDITAKVVVTGTIDTNTAGTYYQYYNVKDAAGNAAATVTRTIVVASPSQCFTTTNSAHVSAGRAYTRYFLIYATGSNTYLGRSSTTTTLKQTSPGYWSKVSSCD